MDVDFSRLKATVNKKKAVENLGTLGYGNHYIEIDTDSNKNYYVGVHSGSRHLGQEIVEYYLTAGQEELRARGENVSYELTYLTGNLMLEYLKDLRIAQKYAFLNRQIMLEEIIKGMKWKIIEIIDCPHNYIDFTGEKAILRKGAISAREGEKVIIPINMRDGVIIGKGKGSADWNFSAPHGSGIILKRTEVKNHHTVLEFKTAMKGIYSTSISKETLDESPFAYRGVESIKEAISETVEIEKILRPVYNFKAGSMEG